MNKKRQWKVVILLLIAAGGLFAAGCQCLPGTSRYGDLIDDVSESSPHFDCWYRPCWDLNRVGHSDWCSCWLNRKLFSRCCCCQEECYAETDDYTADQGAESPSVESP